MKIKPWQLAVIIIGLVVGLGSMVWQLARSGDPDLKHEAMLIDVETGEMFSVDTVKYPLVLPAVHPETGKTSLIRITKDEAGAWYVPTRDLGMLPFVGKDVQVKAVDPESGDIKIKTDRITNYSRKRQ